MIYDLMLRDTVVPLRGDFPRADTRGDRASFSKSDLDKIAPLAPGDERWLGENCFPSCETMERVEARIEAARRLKYGA